MHQQAIRREVLPEILHIFSVYCLTTQFHHAKVRELPLSRQGIHELAKERDGRSEQGDFLLDQPICQRDKPQAAEIVQAQSGPIEQGAIYVHHRPTKARGFKECLAVTGADAQIVGMSYELEEYLPVSARNTFRLAR